MERFLTRLCVDKSLDKTDVLMAWKTFDTDNTKYNKMKKPELIDICKQHGYDTSGTKPDIIDHIMNKKPAPVKQAIVKKSDAVAPPHKDILAKLKAVIPPVLIKRNEHNNFEHSETRFIFNNKTTEVIGVQLDDGDVRTLTRDDIEICNKYNFKYVIPFNLSSDKTESILSVDEELDDDMLDEDRLTVGIEEDEESEDEIEYDENF
jgi:hypothetical protein